MAFTFCNLVQTFDECLNVRSALRKDVLFLDVDFVELNNVEVAEKIVAVGVQKSKRQFSQLDELILRASTIVFAQYTELLKLFGTAIEVVIQLLN